MLFLCVSWYRLRYIFPRRNSLLLALLLLSLCVVPSPYCCLVVCDTLKFFRLLSSQLVSIYALLLLFHLNFLSFNLLGTVLLFFHLLITFYHLIYFRLFSCYFYVFFSPLNALSSVSLLANFTRLFSLMLLFLVFAHLTWGFSTITSVDCFLNHYTWFTLRNLLILTKTTFPHICLCSHFSSLLYFIFYFNIYF